MASAPPMRLKGKLKGVEQTIKNLNELGSTKARAVSRRALTSASSIPLKKAKQNAPVRTGLLKRSLGKKAKTYRSTGTTFVAIGPRPGFRDPLTGGNPVNYAHLVELGTVNFGAEPFMRPALIQSKDEVVKTYQTRTWEGIRREAERMKK